MSAENPLAELRVTTRAEHDRIEHILRLAEPMTLERHGAIRDNGPPQIAPALPIAFGAHAPQPPSSPLADIHIDLPGEDGSGDADDTLVELPMEDADDAGGDTLRMPL